MLPENTQSQSFTRDSTCIFLSRVAVYFTMYVVILWQQLFFVR